MAKIFGFCAELLVVLTIVTMVSVKSFQIPSALQAILNWKPRWINSRRHDHALVVHSLPESDLTQVYGTESPIYLSKPSLPAFLNLEPSWISPELSGNSILHHDPYLGPQLKLPERFPQQSSLSAYLNTLNSQFAYPTIPAVMPAQQFDESLAEDNESYYDDELETENHDIICLHNVVKPFAFVFLPLAALALSLNAASLFLQKKFYIPTTITAVSTTTMTTVSTSISIQYSTEISISTAMSTTTFITTETSTSVSKSLITSTETITETSTSTSISTTTVTPSVVRVTETSTETDTVSVTETSVSVSTSTITSTTTDVSTTTLLSTSTVTTTITTPSVTTSISVTTIMPNTVSVTTTQLSTQVVTSTTTSTTTSTITTTLTSTSISYNYQTCCICEAAECDCGGFANCLDIRRKRKDLESILQTKADSLPIQPTMAPVNTYSLYIDG